MALVLSGELPRRVLALAAAPVAGLGSVIAQHKGFGYHFHPITAATHAGWLVVVAMLWERFRGTPVKRTGRDRVVRNCLIAAGNSGDPSLLPQVAPLLADASPIVRAMAVWAFRHLAGTEAVAAALAAHAPGETDAEVRKEWDAEARI